MAKDPKKLLRSMMIVSIIIGLVALAVAVVAVAMKEYIIAAAMLIVAGWQVVNYLKWKNACKDRNIRRNIQSDSHRSSSSGKLSV